MTLSTPISLAAFRAEARARLLARVEVEVRLEGREASSCFLVKVRGRPSSWRSREGREQEAETEGTTRGKDSFHLVGRGGEGEEEGGAEQSRGLVVGW